MPGTRDSDRLFSTVSILQLVPSPVLLKQIKIVRHSGEGFHVHHGEVVHHRMNCIPRDVRVPFSTWANKTTRESARWISPAIALGEMKMPQRLGYVITVLVNVWASFSFLRGSSTGAPPLYSHLGRSGFCTSSQAFSLGHSPSSLGLKLAGQW